MKAYGSGNFPVKYRNEVMKAYGSGNFPVFAGHNHMQYQIRDPKGFAQMLESIVDNNRLPALPFLSK